MTAAVFWIAAGIVLAAVVMLVDWTSVKYGSDNGADMRSLKGKPLTEKQIDKLRILGLSDEEMADILTP